MAREAQWRTRTAAGAGEMRLEEASMGTNRIEGCGSPGPSHTQQDST